MLIVTYIDMFKVDMFGSELFGEMAESQPVISSVCSWTNTLHAKPTEDLKPLIRALMGYVPESRAMTGYVPES